MLFDKWYFYGEVQNYHSQVHNCLREKSHAIWNKCEIILITQKLSLNLLVDIGQLLS